MNALNEQEADIIKQNEHIEDLLLDNEGELSTEMKNLFVFSSKTVIYENYEDAFTLLKKNCNWNPQLNILPFINNFIKLEKLVNSNVKELRKLFDCVKVTSEH